jgi:hypothetical protein
MVSKKRVVRKMKQVFPQKYQTKIHFQVGINEQVFSVSINGTNQPTMTSIFFLDDL